jgi:hypothetical protein
MTIAAAVRGPDGRLIQELSPLESIDGDRRFRASLTVPGETFIVEVAGTTVGGAEFVRDVTVPAQPQTVGVEASPTASTARPGTAATIGVRVRNLSVAATTYQLQTLSSLGWLVSGPSTVTVAADGAEEVVFSVEVPAGAPEGAANGVTFVAQDSAEARTRNSASVTVIAGAVNQPPVCGDAVAQPSTLLHPDRRLPPTVGTRAAPARCGSACPGVVASRLWTAARGLTRPSYQPSTTIATATTTTMMMTMMITTMVMTGAATTTTVVGIATRESVGDSRRRGRANRPLR